MPAVAPDASLDTAPPAPGQRREAAAVIAACLNCGARESVRCVDDRCCAKSERDAAFDWIVTGGAIDLARVHHDALLGELARRLEPRA